ncbi:6,7-dimethyl-8-ribityllumazine synthase [bacterium]|nr:6,7-dimethyl-8-ribityllumazine synthase [bacterium]
MATGLHQAAAQPRKATGLRFALAVSGWNAEITHALRDGCLERLHRANCASAEVFAVPGSFELVHASARLAASGRYDAVVAIGSVIQGETRHFEFICQAVAQGIAQLNTQSDCPVVFCVLTDNTWEQAKDRSGGRLGNKGIEAADAAIEMALFGQALRG